MKKIILSSLLLLFCAITFAQNTVTIPYGESIDLENVKENTHFYISSSFGKVHLIGEQINNYKFEKPGTYKIKIVEKIMKQAASCDQHHFPEDITINVSRVKMIFDSKNLAFSEPIRKNISTERIIMTIPVSITTYDHKSVMLGNTPVNSAGIGTSIIARPIVGTNELREGTHLLKYRLTGLVNVNSYLMFDFVDANNEIQSVALLTPVKN